MEALFSTLKPNSGDVYSEDEWRQIVQRMTKWP